LLWPGFGTANRQLNNNAGTIALDDPTLDAMGDASNATRITDSSPSGNFGRATATRGPRSQNNFLATEALQFSTDRAWASNGFRRLRILGDRWRGKEGGQTQ